MGWQISCLWMGSNRQGLTFVEKESHLKIVRVLTIVENESYPTFVWFLFPFVFLGGCLGFLSVDFSCIV